jgi:hypothetical protein
MTASRKVCLIIGRYPTRNGPRRRVNLQGPLRHPQHVVRHGYNAAHLQEPANDVAVRLQEHVMPFFSRLLSFETARR